LIREVGLIWVMISRGSFHQYTINSLEKDEFKDGEA